MIRISTKGRYGTRFMLELAIHYNKGPLLLKEIAQIQEISEGYLQHIVDTLRGAGLIHSHRIGHGGYTLARSPGEITLREILGSLEGTISLVECIENPGVCTKSKTCASRKGWEELSKTFSRSLEDITLQSILEKAQGKMPTL